MMNIKMSASKMLSNNIIINLYKPPVSHDIRNNFFTIHVVRRNELPESVRSQKP